jgi:acyl carrier protein
MVPSAFVFLAGLPRTPTGKMDRRALPEPDIAAYAGREYEPPQGDIETAIASVWEKVLRVDRVGRRDNFFELGGHSLLGIKLITGISERLEVALSVTAIFQHPTVEEMAAAVQSLRRSGAPAPSPEEMEFDEGYL